MRARAKVIYVYDLLQVPCTIYKTCPHPWKAFPHLACELERVLCLASWGILNTHRFRVNMSSETISLKHSIIERCTMGTFPYTSKNVTKCPWWWVPSMSSSLPRGVYPPFIVQMELFPKRCAVFQSSICIIYITYMNSRDLDTQITPEVCQMAPGVPWESTQK